MASTNPKGGSMGLQGPPYAVLSPLVTDPPDPPGDPESSLFLTCHFVLAGRREQNRRNGQTHRAYRRKQKLEARGRKLSYTYADVVVAL